MYPHYSIIQNWHCTFLLIINKIDIEVKTMKYTFMENFKDKDPEFYDFYSHFIGEEVINDTTLDDKSRYLSITAVLVGTKAHDLFKDMLDDLLKYLTADEIQEVLYQAVVWFIHS